MRIGPFYSSIMKCIIPPCLEGWHFTQQDMTSIFRQRAISPHNCDTITYISQFFLTLDNVIQLSGETVGDCHLKNFESQIIMLRVYTLTTVVQLQDQEMLKSITAMVMINHNQLRTFGIQLQNTSNQIGYIRT